ncbi:CBM96 family carbohydrate-binding protein [Jidongwangia harbinensis]|uniref:CBM96 family carbohydrate-binding protein n=1 Tax=Jidongwangia harbinensis TaxID=2878561 RepID=UPI001CD9FCA6|nr:DNRLRE domain-containing protein [Jidongwangia harbinensis]MCA2213308.1 DNRLRE domain-containing protein [Jidongwangia harbinensis]
MTSTGMLAVALVGVIAAVPGSTAAAPAGPAAPAPSATTTVTVAASADTFVAADAPTRNHGTADHLTVDRTPAKIAYLSFVLSGLTAPVTRATLRLHTRDTANAASPAGGKVAAVTGTGWSESATTYRNRPAVAATALATVGPVSRNRWYDLDVTAAVVRDGTVSLAVLPTHDDSTYFDSRDLPGLAPRLVVTTTAPSTTVDPVLLAAGDIADCASAGDEATAALLDTLDGTIAAIGDTAYLEGTAEQFARCYAPSWGRHRSRTRPAVGNHEYRTPGAAPYFAYFGAAAGEPGKGYYSYDLGQWHVVVLNSNCTIVSCAAGSAQERWLRADLAADTSSCTLAYWHHPLFTSATNHSGATATRPLYQALYDDRADLVLTGHNHNYERFAPLDPQGRLDTGRGMRQFVVGMGGASHYPFGAVHPHSEARNATAYGILRLTLRSGGYDWLFVPEAGQSYTDAGSAACRS